MVERIGSSFDEYLEGGEADVFSARPNGPRTPGYAQLNGSRQSATAEAAGADGVSAGLTFTVNQAQPPVWVGGEPPLRAGTLQELKHLLRHPGRRSQAPRHEKRTPRRGGRRR